MHDFAAFLAGEPLLKDGPDGLVVGPESVYLPDDALEHDGRLFCVSPELPFAYLALSLCRYLFRRRLARFLAERQSCSSRSGEGEEEGPRGRSWWVSAFIIKVWDAGCRLQPSRDHSISS